MLSEIYILRHVAADSLQIRVPIRRRQPSFESPNGIVQSDIPYRVRLAEKREVVGLTPEYDTLGIDIGEIHRGTKTIPGSRPIHELLLPVQFHAQQTTAVRIFRLRKRIKIDPTERDVSGAARIDRIIDVLIEGTDRHDSGRFEVVFKRDIESHRFERFQLDVSCRAFKSFEFEHWDYIFEIRSADCIGPRSTNDDVISRSEGEVEAWQNIEIVIYIRYRCTGIQRIK